MAGLYEGDSLFTLAPAARAGLVAVAGLLALGLLFLLRRAARPSPGGAWGVAGRLALAGLGFLAFLWLAPQAFYFYYQAVINDLPWQVVLRWPPPGPVEAARLMAFAGPPTLADHARGALGWVVLAWALGPPLIRACKR